MRHPAPRPSSKHLPPPAPAARGTLSSAAALALLGAIAPLSCAPREPVSPGPVVVVAATAPAPEAAPTPVGPWKIGAYLSLSGEDAAFGTSARQGFDLATAEVNERGGVAGRPLSLLYADDASTLPGAVSAVLKLIERDKVVALLGEVSSARSRAGGIIANKSRIPMLSPTATHEELTRVGPFVFRACFTDSVQGKVAADFAVTTRGQRRAALLFAEDDVYSSTLADTFRQEARNLGATIVVEERFLRKESDFSGHLQQIRAAAPDVVFAPVYYNAMILIARQAQQLGMPGSVFLGGDGWESAEVVRDAGAELEGATFVTHWAPDASAPASRAFVTGFRARFHQDPESVAALGYEAARMLADALGRARGDTPEAIRAALQETTTFPGLLGPITVGPDRNPLKSAVIVRIERGRFAHHATVDPR